MRIDTVHAIVMCKAPVAGRVKTRLTPTYSAGEAAAIHRAMAETVIKRAASIFSHTSIAADDVSHPFFEPFDLPLLAQGEGDLGERMSRLMIQAFADGAGKVMFLGTDSPHMDESRLRQAVERLSHTDVVIGPVEDGGYDLIAMNRSCPELFRFIHWGSEQVLEQTLDRAKPAGITIELLETGFDLDSPECLKRAAALWQPPIDLRRGKYPEK